MIREVEYFEKVGAANTDRCMEIVQKMVREEGFEHIVVASTHGDTALKLKEALAGLDVNWVVVTHSAGFKEVNKLEFTPEARKSVEEAGGKVLTTTILTHSIETALAQGGSAILPTHIVAQSLRRWGQGSKVACEIVMEAADAGLIPEKEKVIAVAGTGRGADTVCVILSAASKRFLELSVTEYRAKPAI